MKVVNQKTPVVIELSHEEAVGLRRFLERHREHTAGEPGDEQIAFYLSELLPKH